MTTEPLELPEHLSFSQKSSVQKCSWQWALGRLLNAPQEPSWAAVGGTAVHSATEEWDRDTLKDNWETDPKHLEDLWIHHFDHAIAEEAKWSEFPVEAWRASGRASKQWPDKENRAWWDDNGPTFLRNWVGWRMNNPAWQIAWVPDPETGEALPGIELEGKVTLAGVPVKFFIDRVFENPNHDLLVLDLKSGSHKPDDGSQLGTYGLGLWDNYEYAARWGCYWMARDGGTLPFEDMRMWPRERLDWEYNVARQIQEQGLLTPTKSNLCGGCSVRASCFAVNGEHSDDFPLPWEVKIAPRQPSS